MVVALVALLGLFDSLYLSLSRLQSASLVCVGGSGCDVVQASPWSTLPPGNGIPVAFIGVGGYLVLGVLGMVSLHRERVAGVALPLVLLVLSSLGLLFSAYLLYTQLFIIGDICFWCTLSAMFELIIWVAALLDWRAWRRTRG
jgi:uncharacterized membrane protein